MEVFRLGLDAVAIMCRNHQVNPNGTPKLYRAAVPTGYTLTVRLTLYLRTPTCHFVSRGCFDRYPQECYSDLIEIWLHGEPMPQSFKGTIINNVTNNHYYAAPPAPPENSWSIVRMVLRAVASIKAWWWPAS